MKRLLFASLLMLSSFAALTQGSVTFNFTGGPQNWVVPSCVSNITLTIAGAEGGTSGGANGGDGAVITATIPVNAGDVINMIVGGQGNCPGAGYNGGGNGFNSSDGNINYIACGGGGSTDVRVNGGLIAVAAGGGGAGGGSVNNNGGGNGGCANGFAGANTFGAGGGGGSQVAGGNGGAPWAGTPPGGQNGSAGQGGNGGFWQTASGGGGGGGFFGGGGGGNDGCCTGGNGGGGGGGGSSLIPGGAGCAAGTNTGHGFVTITWGCENVLPTASTPPPINVQCNADIPPANVLVINDEADNCDPAPVVAFVGDVSDGNTCPETITRTYSVTDVCNNVFLVNQTITVNDTQNPTASNPPPINAGSGPAPPPNPAVVTDEADNCGVPTVAFVSDVSDGNVCPETITRTYSVTDACGNQILVTQLIMIGDAIFPTASNPAPINVECIAQVPAQDVNVVTDEADNGGVPVVAYVGDVSDGNSCPETITRTYSVTDACGNQITVDQTITVNDVTPPVMAAPPANTTIECVGDMPAMTNLGWTDNCDGAGMVAGADSPLAGGGCGGTIVRTWTYTDACGNVATSTQTFTIDDNTNPTASNPPDMNVAGGTAPPPDVTVVTDEADNCGVPTVAFVSDVSDGGNCPETITRTYSVTDACGNSINVIQLILIGDPFPPTGTAPADITVECIGDVPAADQALVTDEADNNGVPIVTHLSDISDGNTCPEVISRTYRITDPCGNVTDVVQLITVQDTQNPTASNPTPINVECIGDVPVPDVNLVTDEADNCTAAPVVAFVSDVSDGNTCPEIITRTFSITDDCGNTINVAQTITVDDLTNPTASNPADINQAGGVAPAPDVTVVIDEADNCTALPTVAFVSDISDNNPCPETITRTYSVTDDCGNQILVTQNIIISDQLPPTGTAPGDITVECIGDVPAADPALIVDEADNNGVPVVTHLSDVSDGNTCPEVISRTYRITDACGNITDVIQLITVDDTQNPTASNPAPVAVQCIGDVPTPDVTVVMDEADNCTAAPLVAFVSDVSDGNTCPEVITRTYSVTDDCGNTINVTQAITVNDTQNPTASNPAPIGVECIADLPVPDVTVVTDEADNCAAAPVVAFVSDVSDGNTCPEVITRTYSVTDDCGNTINVTQTITVDDQTYPTASNPAPINVSCVSMVPAPDPAVVTDASDNCSVPQVAFVSDLSDGNSCNGEVITRTYSVTDACGNAITVTQQIIIDVMTPIIDAGLDQSVCEGTMVSVTAINPDAASITWDNGANDGVVFSPPLGTSTYTVTASQCAGECVATDQVDITVNSNPVIAFEGDELVGCSDHTVNFTNMSTEQFNCVWDFGDGTTGTGCALVANTYQNAGLYDVTLTVTSAEGCTSSETYYDYIDVIPEPVAAFSYDPGELDVLNTQVNFTNNSLFAQNYTWSFGDNSPMSNEEHPTHAFPEIGDQSYTVTLLAESYGCVDQTTVIIHVQDQLVFFVPNIFTPDGNDVNNEFLPVFSSGLDIYDYHLTIFNRWGEIVFESYNVDYGWTGHYGTSGLVDDGAYIWQIDFGETMTDKRHHHRGHVTVLK